MLHNEAIVANLYTIEAAGNTATIIHFARLRFNHARNSNLNPTPLIHNIPDLLYIILYYIVLYFNISYYIILYHNIFYYISICHIISYYIILYHIMLYHVISYYVLLYYIIYRDVRRNIATHMCITNIYIYTYMYGHVPCGPPCSPMLQDAPPPHPVGWGAGSGWLRGVRVWDLVEALEFRV